jgi:dTDP-4-dehydrorhamnose 3,5-epimerase
MIEGVLIKQLVTHADDRGFFRELIRVNDEIFNEGFGQLSHSLVYPGVIKAWHGHMVQYQWTYVISGVIHVIINDLRKNSPTYRETAEFILGDEQIVHIYLLPPGVVHGYQCVKGPAHILYITSGTFDHTEEIRISSDDPDVMYSWNK